MPRGLTVHPNPAAVGEDWPVYSGRMRRDGWALVNKGKSRSTGNKIIAIEPETWERRHPGGKLTLRSAEIAIRFTNPGGYNVMQFTVSRNTGKEILTIDGARWADWDHRGRLVVAQGGQLLACEPHGEKLTKPRVLADFTANTPGPVPPAGWATTWPWGEHRRNRRR